MSYNIIGHVFDAIILSSFDLEKYLVYQVEKEFKFGSKTVAVKYLCSPLQDPGISNVNPDAYAPYEEGLKDDIFMKNSSGQLLITKVPRLMSSS